MVHDTDCRFETLVDLPRDRAFALVVDRPGLWWISPFGDQAGEVSGDPASAGSEDRAPIEAAIDPYPGGSCYQIDGAGRRIWGTVLSIEPPLFVRLAWQVTPEGTQAPDPATASRVMIGFRETGPQTRLEVVHSEFLRHGEAGNGYLERMRAPEGWPRILDRLRRAARTADWR